MTLEIQSALVSVNADGLRQESVLRRTVVAPTQVPRVGDHLVANENWETTEVRSVTWDEALTNVVVQVGPLDADEVGPIEVAEEVLRAAGWEPVPEAVFIVTDE